MKRTMKRILALVLTLCMLAALPLAIPAGAEDEAPVAAIGYQTSAVSEGKWNLRLVAKGNDTTYQNVGFRVTVEGDDTRTWDRSTSVVYQSILAGDAAGATYEAVTAEGQGAAYLYVMVIKNVPATADITLHVTPYATQADGSTVDGKTVDLTVKAHTTEYDLTEDVRWFGRTWEQDGTHWMNWTASGFTFSFIGTGAEATFVSNVTDETFAALVRVTVDGTATKKVQLLSQEVTVTLAEGLENGTHTVKVEMLSGNGKSATVGVKALRLTEKGTKRQAPAAPDGLKMEIIGDSMSVGYGVFGTLGDSWNSLNEDGTLSYAALAARALGIAYQVTAVSGKGIAYNYGGNQSKRIPDIYTKTDAFHYGDAEWDFAAWQPDLVVINLGTNDADATNESNLTAEDFRTACAAFLKTVREKNPNAYIIYAYGVMNTKFAEDIQAVIADCNTAGDDRMSYLALDLLNNEEKATNSHPSLNANVTRSAVLIEKIQELFGSSVSEKTTPAEIAATERALTVERAQSELDANTTLLTPTVMATSEAHSGSASDVFADNDNYFQCKPETVESPNYIDVKLAKQTRITRIVTKREATVSNAANRMSGTKVMGSADGLHWTLLCTLTKQDTVFMISDAAAYSYIRLEQAPGKGWYWTVSTVLLYGVESENDITPITGTLTAVTYDESMTKTTIGSGTPAALWDTSDLNGTYTQSKQATGGTEARYIGGAFSTGTVITKIIYHSAASNGHRARGSWFEASVDGVRWFKIATLPSNMTAGATVELDVTCLSQFRYIRMVQPSGYYTYNWTLGVAEVYGVPAN